MRSIRQPGPPPAARAAAVPARLHAVAVTLPPGALLRDTLRDALGAEGFVSAALAIEGGGFGPFGYVMPALSPDATRAAWYSDAYHPPGLTRLDRGAVTFGRRDGAPFFHAHAAWTDAEGTAGAGHILPEAAVIAAPIRVTGVALSGACFTAVDDPETGFRLFEPVPAPPVERAGGRPGLALRLRPNQDITLALEALAEEAGFGRAVLRGGVGSTIGARYEDRAAVEPFATEMFVTAGRIGGDGRLAVGMVDYTGGISAGRLLRGDNPVLMTFEAVLDPEE
jgi:predicted DNA-binding protein with PD1-like motif